MLPTFILVGAIMLSTSIAGAQTDKGLEEWLQFRVFATTREQVEKMLGESGKPDTYFVRYKNSRGSVYVEYSKGDCKSANPLWDVPPRTVIEVSYTPHLDPPKLADLISNGFKFLRRPAGDVGGHIEYYDDKEGISIVYDETLQEVRNVTIKPSVETQKKYGCSFKEVGIR